MGMIVPQLSVTHGRRRCWLPHGLLAGSGRSRWSFVLESFVRSGLFGLGMVAAMLAHGHVRPQEFCFGAAGAK